MHRLDEILPRLIAILEAAARRKTAKPVDARGAKRRKKATKAESYAPRALRECPH